MRHWVLAAAAAVVLVGAACGTNGEAGPPTSTSNASDEVSVARDIDGDSLELVIDGDIVEVRLVGINAPELADCQGRAARDALGALLAAGDITVEAGESDRFGRRLVWLRAGDVDVNRAMVRRGWALANHGDGRDMVDDMRSAAAAAVGLWDPGAGDCTPPPVPVTIVDAEPDPPGPDDENMNGEYVVLRNDSDAAVDVSEWILRDESTGNRFVLPGVEIGPGRELKVRTGCGTDSADEVFWCSRFPVWSNRGETVLLLGPDGAYVSHLFL